MAVKTKNLLIEICTGLLVLLFFYAAGSKLVNYGHSKREMLNQVFPVAIARILVWAVPVVELAIVGLLLYKPARLKGLYASAVLLFAFTLYIAISMSGIFGRVPCSCGGILKHMGYWTHLIFNLCFIGIAVMGIALSPREGDLSQRERE